jgi:hypothetical protein
MRRLKKISLYLTCYAIMLAFIGAVCIQLSVPHVCYRHNEVSLHKVTFNDHLDELFEEEEEEDSDQFFYYPLISEALPVSYNSSAFFEELHSYQPGNKENKASEKIPLFISFRTLRL